MLRQSLTFELSCKRKKFCICCSSSSIQNILILAKRFLGEITLKNFCYSFYFGQFGFGLGRGNSARMTLGEESFDKRKYELMIISFSKKWPLCYIIRGLNQYGKSLTHHHPMGIGSINESITLLGSDDLLSD